MTPSASPHEGADTGETAGAQANPGHSIQGGLAVERSASLDQIPNGAPRDTFFNHR